MNSVTMWTIKAVSFGKKACRRVGQARRFTTRLTAEQLMIKKTCRDFGRKELLPIAAKLDQDAVYPEKQIRQLGSLGLMGMCVSPSYSGMGLDCLSLALAVEELSACCASTGVIMSIHNCLYANLLDRRGTDKQKEEFLLPFTKGTVGCFALSEPNAGSDVANIQTTARKDGDHWILNGTKSWVTSAHDGRAIIVFATVDKTKRHRGITAFIMPRDSPGITLGPREDLMGIRALSTCNVTLEDVRVHQDLVLGHVGEGFKIAMAQLDQARIGISSQALGISQAALDCAIEYALHRHAFGAPLAQISAVQHRLADMSVSLEGARLLVWRAAEDLQAGVSCRRQCSTAKVAASTCASLVTDHCVQILGGMGLVRGLAAERHYRDARVTQIYGGVTDIQKMVIAQTLVKEYILKDKE